MLGFAGMAASLPTPDYRPAPGLSRDTPLQIIFTSGTTGEPKGIVHTHGNVLASLDPLEKEMGKYLRYERLVHPLRILHTLPLSHVFGQFMGLWVPPLLVAEVHFEDRLQAPRLARLLHQERISVLAAVPRVLDLLRAWLEAEFPGLRESLGRCPGRVDRETLVALPRRASPAGMEVLGIRFGGRDLAGRPGELLDHRRLRPDPGLRDDRDDGAGDAEPPVQDRPRAVSANRSPDGRCRSDRMARSWCAATPSLRRYGSDGGLQARDPGWLATGDLATRNAEGELIFAGRKSDVIVTSAGLNIHPEDLEAVLRRQPGVRDCLVVAYDSTAGPAPAAVLIPDAADEILQAAIDAANRELAPFQQIRYWLRWPQPEFPRTSTGKVLRRTVQSWAQQSLAPGSAAAEVPSDRLLEVLRQLGAPGGEVASSDRLAEDLHLDSLAMVQLQSTLETRFGVELDDGAWGQVRTVGDLAPAAPASWRRNGRRRRAGKRDARSTGTFIGERPGTVTGAPQADRRSRFSPMALVAGYLLGACRLSGGNHAAVGAVVAEAPHCAAGRTDTALIADRQPSHGVRCSGDPLCPEQQ